MDKTRKFWVDQDPVLENMLLNVNALEIDQLERPEVLSYLPKLKKLRVLDLGAGIGRFTGSFAKKGAIVTAVDINKTFLQENERENQTFSNITYLHKDLMDISFPKGSFDLIFASGIFMYMEDQEMVVLAKKLYSWLENGGHLFFRESLSPFDHPHKSTHAILRPFSYYQELFDSSFKLANVGSLKSHIKLFGDPFRCFWLFRKDPVKAFDKLI